MTGSHQLDESEADIALRVRALEQLLTEKGLIDPAALAAFIDQDENKIGPKNGAQVVARAWIDPAYKARLLENGAAAIAAGMAEKKEMSK